MSTAGAASPTEYVFIALPPLRRVARRTRVRLRRRSLHCPPGPARGGRGRPLGRLSLHAPEPEGLALGAVAAHCGLPQGVRRQAPHRQLRGRRQLDAGRGPGPVADGKGPRPGPGHGPPDADEPPGGDGMSGTRVRQPAARIDGSRQLRFSFNGRDYTGHPGDTLASALLAQGVRCVARSFKYGRPRGIIGAGAEEPNALVQLGVGALTTPNVKATQAELYEGLVAHSTSGWPALAFDLKSLLGRGARSMMPAGFYGKTFKWPRRLWPLYEAVLRRCAGWGAAPGLPDPERYDHLHHHVDVLVVGARPPRPRALRPLAPPCGCAGGRRRRLRPAGRVAGRAGGPEDLAARRAKRVGRLAVVRPAGAHRRPRRPGLHPLGAVRLGGLAAG